MMPTTRELELGGARSVKDGPPATREILVNVTRAHIDAGARSDTLRCPIALAMAAAGVNMAIASSVMLGGMVDGESFALVPGQLLADFMQAFDDGQVVKPFAFQLTVPLALRDPAEALDA